MIKVILGFILFPLQVRVPLALMSIQASNAGGFGDLSKIAKVYHMIEMLPVINKLKDANKETGQKIFDFSDFELQ